MGFGNDSSGGDSGKAHRRSLSASELSGFFECQRLAWLNSSAARGEREMPGRNELERWMLEYRGHKHEAKLLEWYRNQGLEIIELSPAPSSSEGALAQAAAATLQALRSGADLVYQGTLRLGDWVGRPDFLKKAPGESALGDFHYEVVDAKLARHAQARAIIQLCEYSEQLGALQGRSPDRFWIAIGGSTETEQVRAPLEFRLLDYVSYYRRARQRFERFVAAENPAEPYPEPVEHCDVCRWWKQCEERRRSDDHISLVAGNTRRQRDRLALAGVVTATELARLEPECKVDGIDSAPLWRLREQARLQVAARGGEQVLYELLPAPSAGASRSPSVESGTGLERLPLPTPGDLFLDLEGDAYAFGGGIEYLFGLLELGQPSLDWSRRTAPGAPRYHAHWASTRAEEKRAFEAVIRRIATGLNEFPELHVYHFGQREVDALRKLSCRHSSSEELVDRLLREHVLVDLHAVVRQSLRASVESYSLKRLEPLYGLTRATDPRRAALAMQRYGFWLETGEALSDLEQERATLARYNEDDCRSAWQLRDWLERRREDLERQTGRAVPRPVLAAAEQQESKSTRNAESAAVVEELQAGLPLDASEDTDEQRGRRVLAQLVGWHWREQKSAWWEYFRVKELPPVERLEDRQVLAGLSAPEELGTVDRSYKYRYHFPEQEHAIRRGKALDPDTDKEIEVLAVGASHVDVKRGKTSKQPHPQALAPGRPVKTDHQEQRLLEIARSVARHGFAADEFPSARALLLRAAPRCGQAPGAELLAASEDTVAGVVRLALGLQPGVLAVQGPPGSGKTHRAAQAILALIRAGKRVGITANSHQVIQGLLRKCCERAQSDGQPIRALHVRRSEETNALEDVTEEPLFAQHKEYAPAAAGLRDGSLQLVGATSFGWAREEFRGALDVLVVDEAAQISLANVLAVSSAAPRLILFGDPAQLEQPQRGVHPPGADVSALEYLLGDALTMPPELGVFLAETRRLHPKVCAFTSRVFYESRLHALPGLEAQAIVRSAGAVPPQGLEAQLQGSGLRFIPVPHHGNTQRADEEVEVVAEVVGKLLGGDWEFSDKTGQRQRLLPRHVLVVAPYNAQVAALRRRLEEFGRADSAGHVQVGTVDKFQGREAPVVIYSMASSTASDAPRGFEFLYSLNRLNVATSRAQALVILVASPELLTAPARNDRQLKLVNALCSYLELVEGVPST